MFLRSNQAETYPAVVINAAEKSLDAAQPILVADVTFLFLCYMVSDQIFEVHLRVLLSVVLLFVNHQVTFSRCGA